MDERKWPTEKIKLHKGIGEAEIGLNYPLCKHLNLTTAFRYLFPRQCLGDVKIDVGGFDLRAGLELFF